MKRWAAASQVTWNYDQEPTGIDDGVLSPETSASGLQSFENGTWNL